MQKHLQIQRRNKTNFETDKRTGICACDRLTGRVFRFFVTQRFVTQASQSSWDRRAELDVRLAIPSAQSACGMEITI